MSLDADSCVCGVPFADLCIGLLEMDRYLDYLHGSRLQNLNVTWQFVEKMKQIMPARRNASPNAAEPAPAAIATESSDAADAKNSKKAQKSSKSKKVSAPSTSAPPPTEVDPTKARFLREINYNEMQRSVMRAYFQVPSCKTLVGVLDGRFHFLTLCVRDFPSPAFQRAGAGTARAGRGSFVQLHVDSI